MIIQSFVANKTRAHRIPININIEDTNLSLLTLSEITPAGILAIPRVKLESKVRAPINV